MRTPSCSFRPGRSGGRGRRELRRERLAKAKAVCGRCPVLKECRKHALELPEEYGIWGGLTEEERIAIRASARGRRFATA